MTSYTDEQVLDLIGVCREGPIQAAMNHMHIATILRSLLADRTRLQAEVEALRADRDRLEWLMLHVSDRELRRIGIEHSVGNYETYQSAIDAARAKKGEYERYLDQRKVRHT